MPSKTDVQLIGICKYNHCYVTLDSKKPNNTRGGEGGTKGVQGMISKGVLSGANFVAQLRVQNVQNV